jgi:hypothetical protein
MRNMPRMAKQRNNRAAYPLATMPKGNEMTLSETWASVYWTFPDNAFDYVGKPLILDEGLIYFEGKKYSEVPF